MPTLHLLKTADPNEPFFIVFDSCVDASVATCAWGGRGVGINDPCTWRLFCSQMSLLKLLIQPKAVRPN